MSEGVVLVGLPGVGKSVVGRCVADALGRPFIDLDVEIERVTGRSPADLITHDGENAFRLVERRVAAVACQSAGAIIAAGGGAPLDPLNRWAFMEHGIRIWLDAPTDQLAARLGNGPASRPLLGEDLAIGLRRTREARAPVYGASDFTVDASFEPHVVADAVVDITRRWNSGAGWRPLYDMRYRRHHPAGPEHGRLLMGAGLDADGLAQVLAPFERRIPAVVADRRPMAANQSLRAALPSARLHPIDGGEAVKTLANLETLLTWLTDVGAERDDPLIAVGGGTVGDVAGLAAALHHRGMPLVHLPTTWLAQADSAIGGKAAVDLPTAKNAVGAVWPAWSIVSDVRLLESLPLDRRRDGLAECLKCGLIGDEALWSLVEDRGRAALSGSDPAAMYAMVECAARLKLAVVERDPYEIGERRVLNLGHTIGHALEIESRYTLGHGEAVMLGLRGVLSIAERRGAQLGLVERVDAVLHGLGFPLRRAFDPALVISALGRDKKRERGTPRWILPMAIGRVEQVSDVTQDELANALATISA